MLTAKVQAAQRLTLPFASPKDKPVDDVFADLLRQLGESAEPVRPARAESPHEAEARRREDTSRPERTARAAETEDQTPAGDADPETELDAAPVADSAPATTPDPADQTPTADDAQDDSASPAGTEAQASTPPLKNDRPPAAGTAAEEVIQPVVTGAAPVAAPSVGAAGVPSPSETPDATPNAPSVPEAADVPALPDTTPVPLANAAADPTGSGPVPDPKARAAAPATGEPARFPAATPAPAGSTAAKQPVDDTVPAADPMTKFTDAAAPAGDGSRNAAVQMERPSVSALAQGLGKLGTGAEVALAAQAIGDEMQSTAPGQVRKSGAAAPQGQTAPSPAVQAGSGSPTPTTGAPTPTTGAPTPPVPATAQPPAAVFDLPVETGPVTAARLESALDPHGGLAAASSGSTGITSAAQAAAAPRAAGLPSPAEQLAVQIQRAVGDGSSRITVQLRPAELGSIEVQLDFAQDGRVSASILADRPETLDLLQRDARLLERSLQDAGLKTDSGSLSFDLRGGGRQDQGAPQTAGRTAPEKIGGEPSLAAGSEPTAREATTTAAEGTVDIRV